MAVPISLLRQSMELPLSTLRRRVGSGSIILDASLIEALRGEAARHYHSDSATARKIARRALDFAQMVNDPLALGWGYRAVAEASLFSGRIQDAESAYVEAAASWRKSNSPQLLGQLLVGRIHVLSLLGRLKEAERAAGEARANLEQAGDLAYLAKLAMNLGTMHFQQDRYGPALKELDRAAEIFREAGVRDETVLGLEINRAVALSQLDRDSEALDDFDRIEQECTREGYDLLRAQVAMNAAYVHSQRAEFDLGLRQLATATDYFDRTDHPAFLASCHLNRAEIYHQLNLHREAVDLAGSAIPLFESEGMSYDRAIAMSQAALSSLGIGELCPALRSIKLAHRLFLKEDNVPRAALAEIYWAEILVKRRRLREAEAKAERALREFRRLNLVRWEAAAAVLLTRLRGSRRTPSEQIREVQKTLRRVPARLYPISAYRLLELLGELRERSGDDRSAATSYRRALETLEDVRVRIPTEDSKIAFLQDKSDLYDRMVAIELRRKRPSVGRVFNWMERSRAQSLWDRFRSPSYYLRSSREHPAQGEEEFDREESRNELRRHLSWLHTRLARLELGSPAERSQVAELQQRLFAAEDAWARAMREEHERLGRPAERSGGNGDAARGRPTTEASADIPTPEAISRELPEDTGFLSYHTGSEVSVAVLLTSSGSRMIRLASDLRERVGQLADRLDFQWRIAAVETIASRQPNRGARGGPSSNSSIPDDTRHATNVLLGELYDLLWKPIERAMDERISRWVISPHGPIHRIPLHALRSASHYLVGEYEMTLTPSASIWLRLGGHEQAGRRSAWIGGLTSETLPMVREEVDQVSRSLSNWKVEKTLRPTREAMRRQCRDVQLVHLAAHGELRSDNVAYSFIELDDGPLFVHDLVDFRLPGSTVVLTACSSGAGKAPAGDEWIGMSRGFLQAGAHAVVASLWPIADQATSELMADFYHGVRDGLDPSKSLVAAMRRMIPRRPHPWEWASFAVLGRV